MPWTFPERGLTGPNSITGVFSMLVLAGVVLAHGSLADPWVVLIGVPPVRCPLPGLYLYRFPVLQVLRHHVDGGPDWARMAVGAPLCVRIG